MQNIEARPVQLGLGEKVVGEAKIIRGIIKKNEFIVVPSERGYCNTRLSQKEVELTRVNKCKIWGLSGWRISSIIHVEKNIEGEWRRWPIAEGSVIGVLSKNVKKRKTETAAIIKKNPAFLH